MIWEKILMSRNVRYSPEKRRTSNIQDDGKSPIKLAGY